MYDILNGDKCRYVYFDGFTCTILAKNPDWTEPLYSSKENETLKLRVKALEDKFDVLEYKMSGRPAPFTTGL